MSDHVFFKVQFCLDLDYWKDCDEVFYSLPDAEEFASSVALRSLWTSARVIRVEESVCNEYYCSPHRIIKDFK